MSFPVSPGVAVREIDLTTVVQAAASIEGGFAGKFRWGPVNDRVLVSNEEELVNRAGSPDVNSFEDFFVAAGFLAYTDKLRYVRIGNETDMANADVSGTGVAVLNDDDYDVTAGELSSEIAIAKYPGLLGNSLAVAFCTSAAEFRTTLAGTFSVTRGSKNVTYTPDAAEELTDFFEVNDFLVIDNVRYQVETVAAAALTLVRLYGGTTNATATGDRLWQYATQFSAAPGADEAHVVVIDEDGEFTAEEGSILEVYDSLSLVPGTKFDDGTAAFISEAINRGSDFIRAGGVIHSASSTLDLSSVNSTSKVETKSLSAGLDGNDQFGTDEYLTGYDLFKNAEEVDSPLLIAPAPDTSAVIPNYLIQNIAEVRKDQVVFTSPRKADVVNNSGSEVDDTITFRNLLPSSSYAFLDSGWKYVYDKYNDVFRWVPLSGDTAGLTAQTERSRDAWFAPAGFNRGSVKNVVKLAYSPDQSQRDDLFTNQINPVTDFPGQGTVLFGDSTLLAKASAFSELGVRRLFIILEKAIARFAQFTLFEQNDEFTRNQFSSSVAPFLREIKGRRGLTDFRVVADESNNTPQVIDTNRFVGDIYLKPTRSIRFIRLSFVAVRTGVSFEEVVGQF